MITDRFKGLNDEVVSANRKKYGTNSIIDSDSNGRFWEVIKEIAGEPLFIILSCTTFIYFLLQEYGEGIIMLLALCFVASISLYQENKSRTAVDSLKKLSTPPSKVIRNGVVCEISAQDLVIDDLIVVEDGSLVPADALILEAHDFSVNESILTGESLSILRESSQVIFQGTLVMSGWCVAKITAVGKQTNLGKIGQSLEYVTISKTPLQEQIRYFVRSMVSFGVIAFILVWLINYYITRNILHALLHGLTLAMSVLPEEIPVAFSTFMALGAYHLYQQKVIARNPHTIETLGAATVICTDKTGTITENSMQLAAIYHFKENKVYDYTQQSDVFNEVLEYAMWASEPEPFDMMEVAIHREYAATAPIDKRTYYELSQEYPLSGQPPIMTHVFSPTLLSLSQSPKNHQSTIADPPIIACKGSVEGVLQQTDLDKHQKGNIENKAAQLASKGYRVLGVGISHQSIEKLPKSQHDLSLEFVGLIAFYDPPKNNMRHILNQFYTAGIEVKIITGDYVETAQAIAQQIGLKHYELALTGREVMAMGKEYLQEKVKTVNVFARMFPDAKLKVIEALKANKEVVAMTGDGVNDGPALKAAHIGIAMGLRGSEMAKKAASLILMDDDLLHMVKAVALGRRIYENLKKAIQYIISIHIPIILIVTIPLLLFWRYTDIFSPIHVIFLELIMGPTCSIIFEREPIEANSMRKKPRKMSNSFFSFRELAISILQGIVITVACLGIGYYFMKQNSSEDLVRTLIYTTLIFSNLFLTLVNRSFNYSVFTTIRYKNNLLTVVLILSLVVLFLSIYQPTIRNIFSFVALDSQQLLLCLATAFGAVMWIEVFKKIRQ